MAVTTIQSSAMATRWPRSRALSVRALGPLATTSLGLLVAFVAVSYGHRLIPGLPDPETTVLQDKLLRPFTSGQSGYHVLGTDQLGRDVLARLLAGTATTFTVAITAVTIAMTIGVTLGVAAGMRLRWVGGLVTWLVDVQLSFPALLMAMVLVTVLQPSATTVVLALGFNGWMIFARISRARTLSIREENFIEAARISGESALRILSTHILPNALPVIANIVILEVVRNALAESGLSFLGFGVQPPDVSLGLMLAQGRVYQQIAWWLTAFPGLGILLLVAPLNIIARRIADPRDRPATSTRDSD